MFNHATIIVLGLLSRELPPAAAGILAGGLESAGIDYQFVDLSISYAQGLTQEEWTQISNYQLSNQMDAMPSDLNKKFIDVLDLTVKKIQSYNSDLIAISMLSPYMLYLVEQVCQRLRQALPESTIIIGGASIGIKNHAGKSIGRRLLDQDLVDYYVVGAGEEVFPVFLKDPNADILGVNGKNNLYESQTAQVEDLNSIPFPSYRKIDLTQYTPRENKFVVRITGSKGCVRNCTFCNVPNTWKFKTRTGKNIVEEIKKHFYDTGATEYNFTDSLINGSIKTFRDFNLELIKFKEQEPAAKDIHYTGQFIARPSSQQPESMYQEMAIGGARNLQIGIESGSDRVRFELGKKFYNSDIEYHMDMCSRYNIGNTFLLFVGYPTETRQDFEETLHMINKYQKNLIDESLIDVSLAGQLSVDLDSPIADHFEELKIASSPVETRFWYSTNDNLDIHFLERMQRSLELERLVFEKHYPAYYLHRVPIDESLIDRWAHIMETQGPDGFI